VERELEALRPSRVGSLELVDHLQHRIHHVVEAVAVGQRATQQRPDGAPVVARHGCAPVGRDSRRRHLQRLDDREGRQQARA
jgi:hypothetical protein